MDSQPAITIQMSSVIECFCDHCGVETVQVLGGTGVRRHASPTESACLQCIADGGTCCSLKSLNRRANEGAK